MLLIAAAWAWAPVTPLDPAAVAAAHRALRNHRAPVATRAVEDDLGGWDVTQMIVDLQVDVDGSRIIGEATVEADRTGEGDLVLHATTYTPTWTLDGAPVTPAQDGSTVRFSPSGDHATVGVTWTVTANPWFGLVADEGLLYSTNEPEGARAWLPCHDVPSDRALLDWTFHVPAPFTIAAVGELASADEGGSVRTYHYRADQPLPTYLMAFHAAEYTLDKSDDPVPVWTWAPPGAEADAAAMVSDTPAMIDALAARFGPYPWSRYGNAFVPIDGAMENPGAVSMGDLYLDFPEAGGIVNVHEMGHHWWGDYTTLGTWDDIWLNESFATYSEALWWEDQYGAQGLADYLQLLNEDWSGSGDSGPIYAPDFLFSALVYQKGATVVHMLRRRLGDDVFFPALQDHLARHAYGSHVTADLQEDLEAASGEDLQAFFDLWIYGDAAPEFSVGYNHHVEGDQTQVDVTVRQDGGGPGFTVDLPIRITTSAGDIDETVTVGEAPTTVHFCVDGDVQTLTPDPGYDITRAGMVSYRIDPSEAVCGVAKEDTEAGGCGCGSGTRPVGLGLFVGGLAWTLRSWRARRR